MQGSQEAASGCCIMRMTSCTISTAGSMIGAPDACPPDTRLLDKATGRTNAEKKIFTACRVGHRYADVCRWTFVYTGPHIHGLEPERMAYGGSGRVACR